MPAPAVWVVVGASRGIGLEWVRQLLARGDHVLATVRDVEKASQLWTLAGSAMGRCQLFVCDVASEASINNFAREVAALRTIDRIDHLILNAGILQYPNRATELSFDNFSDHLRTNAVGPIITAQRLLHSGIPIGSIAFMSSDSGSATDFRDFEDGFAAYAASKAALNQMLRHMAAELERKRYTTTILAIHPGEVATDMANVSVGWEVEGIINADESVAGMLRVVEQKTVLDTGTFWTWEGNRCVFSGSERSCKYQPPPHSQVSVEEESSASSFEAELDGEVTSDTLKRSLENCLDNVKTAGSFVTSGVLAEATLSGISVHNVGSIGFPLQEGQAKAIVGVCRRAPFGRGNRTVVDESVRKTWQLNPDQFELRNPKWPSVVQKVTEQVAQELGCVEPASVNAQLYKMLLYEEGAMFKPHKDTEKAPGMFGTLVICFPSEYEGGAVVASHRGESKVFETASAFDHTYIAWYADVTHEVRAITSGHRLVLTYNLIDLSQGLKRSAAMLSREKRMLKGIISSWSRSVEGPASKAPNFLAYKLDHEYTDASLKFQSLKGLDKVKAEYLREVCAGANACFCLASMERTVVGSCEEGYSGYSRWERHRTQGMHTLEEIVEQSTELKRMIDLDGAVLAREISIDEVDIVQKDPFGRDPDKEDFEGYTGNEGASATQFYHDTVAVLVPFSSLARFLSKHVQQGIVDTNSWYRRLLKKVREDPNDEAPRQELYHIAVLLHQTPPRPQAPRTIQEQRRCSRPRKDYFPAPEAQWPIEASIVLEDQTLFEMAIESTKSLSVSIYESIGKATFLFDLPTTHTRINRLISCLSSFHGQCKAFASIVAGYKAIVNEKAQNDDAKLRQIEAWAEKTYMRKLQNVNIVDREDGLHLADLTISQADRKPFREYLHLTKPRAKFTAFSVAFVTRLLRGTDPERAYSVDDAFEVFRELVTDFLPTFSVECRSVAKRGRSESDRQPSPVQCLLSADDVAFLLVLLDRRDLEDEAVMLIAKLEAEAGTVDIVAFGTFFLPLLEALIVWLQWTSERVTRYRKLFRTTLLMYATRFVQIEPQAGNWTSTPQGCGCLNCRQLDAFLINPSQQSIKFPVGRGARQHLHQMLEGTKISHVTDRRGVETLVVTKPLTATLAKHQQWEKRFFKAKGQIEKLDQKILRLLLHGDDYEYLTELRNTKRGHEGLPSARVAVRRQRPEIIDLT